jgi:RNA polymerase sigma-70 factor (sigma-E family)
VPTPNDDLGTFVEHRYLALRRTAYLLCGDWHWAEDLVQIALARVVLAARRRAVDNLDSYAHRVLTRTFLTETQRWFRRREAPGIPVEDRAARDVDVDLSIAVLEALRRLPPRQRATIVLRYWQDLSTEETAHVLGVTTGTVKSQCAKAMNTLRHALSELGVAQPDVPTQLAPSDGTVA